MNRRSDSVMPSGHYPVDTNRDYKNMMYIMCVYYE